MNHFYPLLLSFQHKQLPNREEKRLQQYSFKKETNELVQNKDDKNLVLI